jgi:hypothetical protein
MKKFLLLLTIYCGLNVAYGQTNVSGLISTNTTWTPAGNPYIVSGNTLVDQGITLNIQPGVIIKFSGSFYLYIDGTLNAQGNILNPIVFTSNNSSPQTGDWVGIKFRPLSTVTGNIINYCHIEFAQKGIESQAASPIISNSIIQNNQIGINFITDYANRDVTISNNIITHNIISGISNYAIGGALDILGNEITYNGDGMYSPNNARKINNNIIRHNTNGIYCESGGGCTISEINGNIISDNTNYGLYLQGFTLVIYSFQYNTVSNNGGVGIRCKDVNVTISNNKVVNNNTGIWISRIYNSNIEIHQSCIYQNSFNFKNELSSDVNASNNWWGTDDLTTINSLIYDFYDNFNLGRVQTSPILNAETAFCTTGLATNEIISNNSIDFSPNPFSFQTTLKTKNAFNHATLTILNSLGQTVKQIKDISGQTFTISREQLSSGLYYVQMIEEDKIYNGKLLIN